VDRNVDDFIVHRLIEQAFFALLLGAIVMGALLYARGLSMLWHKAGAGRGIRRGEAVNFVLGWAVLAASLLSPIDAWAEHSFAMHMVQHEMLMVIAAPLIVLGRPLEAWARAASTPLRPLRMIGLFASPLGAWILHALALWLWHLPALFDAAVHNPLLHILQHSCFFGSALVYWWSVFGSARRPKGSAVASLFTTMLHTSALGALLTFAPSAWYAAEGTRAFGLSALEDQQLGGLIMWVPGGMAYMVVGLVVIARWLAPVPRSARNGSRGSNSPALPRTPAR
jgi:putative membrane protein